jgi:putrescine---pyruvate transaminase
MAKGITSGYLPLSATAVSARIATALRDGGDFAHGYTYSGHPVASAVALANIALLKQERLVERVGEDSGPYLAEALGRLRDHPLVGEVRTIGLLGAIEIVATPGTNRRFTGVEGVAGPIVRDYAIDCGLMVRAVRDTIVTCPPLTISHDEIDMIAERLRRALDSAEPALRALA